MIKLSNMGAHAFKQYILEKNIFVFGAGKALEACLELYFENIDIEGIFDNNSQIWGKLIKHNEKNIEVKSVIKLCECLEQKDISKYILIITSPFYAADIIEQLDLIEELDNLECFSQAIIRSTPEEIVDYSFTKGIARIPKKINYVWFGGKELPDEYKYNIETWHKKNPYYEIIEWNENNYPISKGGYVEKALELGCYAFASNYARVDILYQNGGIYLDTDVEAIGNFDCLLNDDIFFCMSCGDRISNGCGFGSIGGHSVLTEIMEEYNSDFNAMKKEEFVSKQGHRYIHAVLKRRGFDFVNQYQSKQGIVIYPTEVMSPLNYYDALPNTFSGKTVSVHRESGSWKTDSQKRGEIKMEEIIRSRIL